MRKKTVELVRSEGIKVKERFKAIHKGTEAELRGPTYHPVRKGIETEA